MLTAEKRVMTMKKGRPVMVWKQIRARNESLDYTVYNLAALAILNPNYKRIKENMQPAKKDVNRKKERPRRKTKGWVNAWK